MTENDLPDLESAETEHSFVDHMRELLARATIVATMTVVCAIFAGAYRATLERAYLDGFGRIFHLASLSPDRLPNSVWGALVALVIFQCALTVQSGAFLAPGLYSDERHILKIVQIWLLLAPLLGTLLAFAVYWVFVTTGTSVPRNFSVLSVSGVRFLIVSVLAATQLALPRTRWGPSRRHLAAGTVIIMVVPNEVVEMMATSVVLLSAAAFIFLILVLVNLRKHQQAVAGSR